MMMNGYGSIARCLGLAGVWVLAGFAARDNLEMSSLIAYLFITVYCSSSAEVTNLDAWKLVTGNCRLLGSLTSSISLFGGDM